MIKLRDMRKPIIIIGFIFIQTCLLFGQSDTIIVPEWYNKPPQKTGVIYGIGRASSSDLVSAERKSRLNAITDLTKKSNNIFNVFISKCDTVLGNDHKTLEIIKTISSECQATLKNVVDKDKKMFHQNNSYIFYYLVEQKTDEAIQAFKKKIKANNEIKDILAKKDLLKVLNELK